MQVFSSFWPYKQLLILLQYAFHCWLMEWLWFTDIASSHFCSIAWNLFIIECDSSSLMQADKFTKAIFFSNDKWDLPYYFMNFFQFSAFCARALLTSSYQNILHSGKAHTTIVVASPSPFALPAFAAAAQHIVLAGRVGARTASHSYATVPLCDHTSGARGTNPITPAFEEHSSKQSTLVSPTLLRFKISFKAHFFSTSSSNQ